MNFGLYLRKILIEIYICCCVYQAYELYELYSVRVVFSGNTYQMDIYWHFKSKRFKVLLPLLLHDTLKYLNTSTYGEVKIQIKYRNGSIEKEPLLFIDSGLLF